MRQMPCGGGGGLGSSSEKIITNRQKKATCVSGGEMHIAFLSRFLHFLHHHIFLKVDGNCDTNSTVSHSHLADRACCKKS